MNTEFFLSIIVPTRERHETLQHCLKSIVPYLTAETELIVSDNCSSPETKRVVDEIKCTNLTYIRPESRLGMSEHWEFALGHARGKWVTIIGDDDGFLPWGISKFIEIASKTHVKAINSERCTFIWPNVADKPTQSLTIRYSPEHIYKKAYQELKNVFYKGQSYKTLPWIYTGGFLEKSLIENIIREQKSFFNSLNPDIYSAIAAATYVKEFLYIGTPLTIAGTSSFSNGGGWKKKDTTHFNSFLSENSKRFHNTLADGIVNSNQIYAYESYLQCGKFRRLFRLSIIDQLALALLFKKSSNAELVSDFVERTAKKNGIPMIIIRLRERLFKMKFKILKHLGFLSKSSIKTKKIEISASNIQIAAVEAQNHLENLIDKKI